MTQRRASLPPPGDGRRPPAAPGPVPPVPPAAPTPPGCQQPRVNRRPVPAAWQGESPGPGAPQSAMLCPPGLPPGPPPGAGGLGTTGPHSRASARWALSCGRPLLPASRAGCWAAGQGSPEPAPGSERGSHAETTDGQGGTEAWAPKVTLPPSQGALAPGHLLPWTPGPEVGPPAPVTCARGIPRDAAGPPCPPCQVPAPRPARLPPAGPSPGGSCCARLRVPKGLISMQKRKPGSGRHHVRSGGLGAQPVGGRRARDSRRTHRGRSAS